MPLNRTTLVVQPIPNLLNFAFLAALFAYAECLLALLDLNNFPVLHRNISLCCLHYVRHLVCSSTRNHQLLKCNPICLSQTLPKIQAQKTKIRGWWKAKDTSTVEDRRLSACAILRNRDEKIFHRVRERALVFQRSSEHNQRWKETAKILLQFLLPATKNPHLLQESTLPECLAQSSYWQTFLCLTYMCFWVFKTKKTFKIKNSGHKGKILKPLLLWKKPDVLCKPTSIKSVLSACYYQVRQTTRELKALYFFPFMLTCEVISQFPPARNWLYLVFGCK